MRIGAASCVCAVRLAIGPAARHNRCCERGMGSAWSGWAGWDEVKRPVFTVMAAACCLLASAWLAGFVWFVHGAIRADAGRARADGIVVLTGGADRIATGLRLLQQGRGRVLLISGVGHGAELPTLLRGTGIDPDGLADRVTLGRSATSTTGNADETAVWVGERGLHSLLIVTASYHMPRALTELQRSLPDVRLIPVPVLPPALRGGSGPATWRLLAQEYTKWLAAQLGLARLGADLSFQAGNLQAGGLQAG